MTPENFIKQYRYYALATSSNGLFPSVKMAQAILESSWGESDLSVLYNNFFGIKAGSKWRGPVANMATLEYYGTNARPEIDPDELFRVYLQDPYNSFRDHTRLLIENFPEALTQPTPYSQAIVLQEGGYATDPNYANKLVQIIEKYELFKLDEKKKIMKNLEIAKAMLLMALLAISVVQILKSL